MYQEQQNGSQFTIILAKKNLLYLAKKTTGFRSKY
jgi:hypothetical protein